MNRLLFALLATLALVAGTLPSARAEPIAAMDIKEELPQAAPVEDSAMTPELLYTLLLAEIAGARGRFDVAVPSYIALTRQTQDPRIAKRATEIALFARNLPAAAETAKLWAESDPRSEDARQVLAGLLAGGGAQVNEAQFQLARILAEHPDHLEQNLLSLNRALGSLPDKEAVRDIIDRLTLPYLSQPGAHFARAHAAATADDFGAAMDEIDTALAMRPDWEPAILFKAQLLAKNRQLEESLRLLQLHLHHEPDSHNVRQVYARLLILQDRPEEALVEFRYLLDAMPDNVDLMYGVAMLSMQLGDFETASPLLERALNEGHHENDGIRMQLGQLDEYRHDYDKALKWYGEIAADSPNYINAQARIAAVYAKQGKLTEARTLLREAGTTEEERQRLQLVEITMLRDIGHLQEAMDLAETGLRAEPDDPALLYESAMIAEKLERLDVMETRLRRLIELEPDNAHAYNALGYSFADHGQRLDEAEKLIGRALELMPEDPYILDSMGWVHFRRGDSDTALRFLQQAYEVRADPDIAAHLGEVLWSLGRHDDARRVWNKALKIAPDNDIIIKTINRLDVK